MTAFWKRKKEDKEDEYVPHDPLLPSYRNPQEDSEEESDDVDDFFGSDEAGEPQDVDSEIVEPEESEDDAEDAEAEEADDEAEEVEGEDAGTQSTDGWTHVAEGSSDDAQMGDDQGDHASQDSEEGDLDSADETDEEPLEAEVLDGDVDEYLEPLVEEPIRVLEEKEEEEPREIPEHGDDTVRTDDAPAVPAGEWLGAAPGIRGADELLPGMEEPKKRVPKLTGPSQIPVVDNPWILPTWIAAGIAVLAAMLGSSASVVGNVSIIVMLLATGVALFLIHRRPSLADRVVLDVELDERRSKAVSGIHVILTLAYNIGIIAVVALLYFAFKGTLSEAIPGAIMLGLAVNVALLMFAVTHQVAVDGGVNHSWKSRVHGIVTVAIGALTMAAVIVVLLADFTIGQHTITMGHMAIPIIVTFLFVNSHAFMLAGLPTNMQLVSQLFSETDDDDLDEDEDEISRTPPFVYAMLVGMAAMVMMFFIIQLFDLKSYFFSFADEGVNYLIVLFPIGLGAFFAFTGISLYHQSRQGLYKERLDPTQRNDILVYSASGLAGIVLSVMCIGVYTGAFSIQGYDNQDWLLMDLLALTLLVTFGPVGIYTARKQKRISSIEQRLPDFLNDLAETQRAGLTLPSALHSAANSDYGALTKEIRKMSHQVAWGVPFTDAVMLFAERTRSELVKRSVNLIVEASNSGGNTADILKAAAKDAFEIKGLEADRKVTLTTYLVVIYVTFFVFLMVIAVLTAQFLPQVIDAQTAIAEQTNPGDSNPVTSGDIGDLNKLAFMYYLGGLVQAIGNGLVGGALLASRFTTGFRHVAGMVFAAWCVFRAIVTWVI